jgi:RsiW-degrading membrane proteinase PrsW (M82 family)
MNESITSSSLFIACVGGILPALFWLWFWLQEDKLHPEPKRRLLLSLVAGGSIVFLVYPLQKMAYTAYGLGLATLLIWATIEEIAKYIAAYSSGLHSKEFNEPIDALIYMITAALGFSAVENTLFLISPLISGDIGQFIVTGNMRFIGASLLHIVTSSVVGYCIGHEFFRGRTAKILWTIGGLVLAIALHTVFNFFILYENGSKTFITFAFVWIGAITIMLLFEKIKKIKK